jgi:hypothetical protein
MRTELTPNPGPHTPSNPRYPDVKVRLSGSDGNAFAVLGRCRTQARRAGVGADEIQAFFTEAMAGDYNALLQTCMRWFDVS